MDHHISRLAQPFPAYLKEIHMETRLLHEHNPTEWAEWYADTFSLSKQHGVDLFLKQGVSVPNLPRSIDSY